MDNLRKIFFGLLAIAYVWIGFFFLNYFWGRWQAFAVAVTMIIVFNISIYLTDYLFGE